MSKKNPEPVGDLTYCHCRLFIGKDQFEVHDGKVVEESGKPPLFIELELVGTPTGIRDRIAEELRTAIEQIKAKPKPTNPQAASPPVDTNKPDTDKSDA